MSCGRSTLPLWTKSSKACVVDQGFRDCHPSSNSSRQSPSLSSSSEATEGLFPTACELEDESGLSRKGERDLLLCAEFEES
eukprot:3921422-Rhodomonas_salina.1